MSYPVLLILLSLLMWGGCGVKGPPLAPNETILPKYQYDPNAPEKEEPGSKKQKAKDKSS